MTDTVLDKLRGGNAGVLGSLRNPEDPVNQEILQQIQAQNAEWEEQKRKALEEMRMPDNALEAAGLAVSARVNQYKSGILKFFGGDGESPSDISERMAPVEEQYPKATTLATVGTDLVATAPIGLGVGAGTAKTLSTFAPNMPALAARGITGLSMGAAEGGAIGLAEEDVATGATLGAGIGAVTEMALPPLMRKIGQVSRKLLGKGPEEVLTNKNGVLQASDEFKRALREVGLTFDDVKNVELTELPKNMTPQQLARYSLFEKHSIPTTRSRITQNADDFGDEVRILRQTGDEGADMVRARVAEESAAIQNRMKDIAEGLGVSDQAGDTIKSALEKLDMGQRANITKAYDELLSVANKTNANAIPLARDQIKDSIDEVLFGTKPVSDETRTAILRAGAKYGILGDDVVEQGSHSIIDFAGEKIRINGKQTPLNLANFEDFRKSLNQAFSADRTGSVSSVKKALDNTVLEATEILADVGDDRSTIQSLAEKARKAVIGRAEMLDTGSLVPRLLNDNPSTGTPFVEASQVAKKIYSQATPPEEVSRLMTALGSSGAKGKKATENLQADVVMRLLDKAFKNAGKLDGGQTPFNVTAMVNELRSIGPKKLETIFKSNKPALKAIKEIQTIGELMRTPASAVQKGSAPDMINAVIRATWLTSGLGGDVAGLTASHLAGRQYSEMSRRAVRRQIIDMTSLNEPEAITFMNQNYPALAAALGITALGTKEVLDDDK